MRTRLLPTLLAALLLCAAAPARAESDGGGRGRGELTGWLVFGAGYDYDHGHESGFGFGGRYRLPLLPQGLLQGGQGQVRDSLDLEFGGDLVNYHYRYRTAPYDYGYSWWALRPRAGVMWNFWLSRELALYPKLDLGYEFGWFDGWNDAAGSHPAYAGLFLEPSLGLIWRFRPATSLRVELGSEGMKLGLGMAF